MDFRIRITKFIKTAKAFLLGVIEFRNSLTTRLDDPLDLSYEHGREIAHRLSFRVFDQG